MIGSPSGLRAASRMTSDAPHRRATRSWPKALGNRLYESLSTTFGISRHGGFTNQTRTSAVSVKRRAMRMS